MNAPTKSDQFDPTFVTPVTEQTITKEQQRTVDALRFLSIAADEVTSRIANPEEWNSFVDERLAVLKTLLAQAKNENLFSQKKVEKFEQKFSDARDLLIVETTDQAKAMVVSANTLTTQGASKDHKKSFSQKLAKAKSETPYAQSMARTLRHCHEYGQGRPIVVQVKRSRLTIVL